MFWFVFIFPGKRGCLLPRETPPRRAAVLAVPAFGAAEAPPAPLRSGRGGASPSSARHARPGIGGLVPAAVGGGSRAISVGTSPCI